MLRTSYLRSSRETEVSSKLGQMKFFRSSALRNRDSLVYSSNFRLYVSPSLMQTSSVDTHWKQSHKGSPHSARSCYIIYYQ
eukprot:2355707-Amphidinium_carterae.1